MSNKLSMSASERINALLDDSSFVEIGAYVKARNTDFNIQDKDTPKDGVITGYGVIDGNLVYVYSQDAKVLGGSIGEMHAKKIVKLYDMAIKMGAPIVGMIDCSGLRLQEATDALNAFGEVFAKMSMASGVIPQVTAIFGSCGGGAALIPTLTDFTYMTEDAKLFVNAPNTLDENLGTKVDTADAAYVSANTANVDAVFETEAELIEGVKALVKILPSDNLDEKIDETLDNPNRIIPNLDSMKNDGRAIIEQIADAGSVIEIKKAFAADIVTSLVKMDGATVGIVANQEDKITTNGAYKAEEFIGFCDAFGIPVVTLVNVAGLAANIHQEKIISKALAKLTNAYADATVPKISVITDKAYGTAYTVMNSKAIGADMVYAWPDAVIGTMDPEMAVKIMFDEEIKAADDKLAYIAEKKAEYIEALSGAVSAAARGYVDDVIEPDATRKRVIAAIDMLLSKEEMRPYKKHSTI